MKTGKKIGIALGCMVLVLAMVILFNFNTARVLVGNWLGPKVTLDETTDWDGGTSYEHINYSDVSETDYLHLYVPESDRPLPLYIMVHGGGFFLGDLETRQAQLFYRYVRDQGYAVASVNYRLGNEAKYPAAIEDVKAAVRFLRANAQQYGLDAERFAIAGESAGGYLACMTAVTTDEEFMGVPFVGEENLDEPVSAKVQAVVDFYGCMEFFTFEEEFETLKIPKFIRTIANSWLSGITEGTEATSMEEVWIGKLVSEMSQEELESYTIPYYAKKNLNQDTELRALILHGDADLTVPYLQSEHFAETMKAQLGEDKVDYRLFSGYGHASDGFYSEETLSWILEKIGW